MFEGKTLMITGGTGSFGNAVLERSMDCLLYTSINENERNKLFQLAGSMV